MTKLQIHEALFDIEQDMFEILHCNTDKDLRDVYFKLLKLLKLLRDDIFKK